MKHLSRFLAASLLIFGLTSVNAQDENNPWAFNIGINAVDTPRDTRQATPIACAVIVCADRVAAHVFTSVCVCGCYRQWLTLGGGARRRFGWGRHHTH